MINRACCKSVWGWGAGPACLLLFRKCGPILGSEKWSGHTNDDLRIIGWT